MNGGTVRRSDEDSVREAIDRADALREGERFAEAADVLLHALRAGAEGAEIHYRLGNVRVDEGNLEAAETCYRKALLLAPNHANATHNLAVVYKRQGRVGLFVRTYKKARRIESRAPRSTDGTSRRVRRLGGIGGRTAVLLVGAAAVLLLVWVFTR
jgi:tetratricopeptide (TPR) repeat protein